MVQQVRILRVDELPGVIQRATETAMNQLVARDRPFASPDAVAAQIRQMYETALRQPYAAVLAIDWPGGGPGPAAHALVMAQPSAMTGVGEVVVLDAYTAPALRGQGLGRTLLEAAREYARSLGCAGVVAQVAIHNQASMRMLTAAGFVPERLVMGRLCQVQPPEHLGRVQG